MIMTVLDSWRTPPRSRYGAFPQSRRRPMEVNCPAAVGASPGLDDMLAAPLGPCSMPTRGGQGVRHGEPVVAVCCRSSLCRGLRAVTAALVRS